jgi:polysaccharide transporter, PST family
LDIIKNSVWSTVSVGLRGLASFLINKLISIFFGPAGITFLSHFQNLSSIFIILPNDGVNKGVIKYLSDQELGNKERSNLFYSALFLSLALFIGTVILFFFLKGFIPNPFPGTDNRWLIYALGLFGFQVLNYYLLSVLLSQKKLPAYVLVHVAGNFISLIFVYFLSQDSGYETVLLGWAVGPALTSLVSLILVIREGFFQSRFKIFRENPDSFRNLGEFILVALSILIFSKVTDFGIREFAILKFNPDQTGLWQSVVRISDFFLMGFLAYLNMVYYPKVSELSTRGDEWKKFAFGFFVKILPFLVAGILLVYFFKREVLLLFFSPEFLPAIDFFPFQLAGDFFKMHSWILSFLLLAQARTRLFILSQGAFSLIYILVAWGFTRNFGLEGLPMAHFLRYAIYWIFMVFVYRELFFKRN